MKISQRGAVGRFGGDDGDGNGCGLSRAETSDWIANDFKFHTGETTLLLINSADDERNPPETGVTSTAMKRVKNGRVYLIPASSETRGHLTTGSASFYKLQLQEVLQSAPQRTM
jgi:hypothetical protein